VRRERLSQLQLVALGTLLGILATALYDFFKAWITPFLLEGRTLEYSDVLRTFIPVFAGVFATLVFMFLLYKWGLLETKVRN